jgi:triosephosphate isomerase
MKLLRKVFIGGNWKCNGSVKFVESHMKDVINPLTFDSAKCDVIISPTNLHIPLTKTLLSKTSKVQISAQNVGLNDDGAFTGEVSAKQLHDFGIHWTLTGHSERRQFFGDTDEIVSKKTKKALDNKISVIACIGEMLSDREAGNTMHVCTTQLGAIAKNVTDWSHVVIAYEPVWAIGTGKTATDDQAQEVHGNLRNWLGTHVSKEAAHNTRIIYGGSVTAKTADVLIKQTDIDGFLVYLFVYF